MSIINRSHNNWKSEILDKLDECAKEYRFPILNNVYFYNADIRLTTFRSSSEWLIIFEEIAFSKDRSFQNGVTAYGNKIKILGRQFAIDDIISEVPGKPIWDFYGNFLLDKLNFELIIGGSVRRFSLSIDDYKNAEIDVTTSMPEPAKILRMLTFLIPNLFFMSDYKLLEICGRANSGLEKFLQIDDWYHPDIAGGELPSQNICFQKLAHSLAINDKNLYECPKELINTHWSNWELE